MTLKSIVCVAALAALSASPAFAQTLSVEIDGGAAAPTLDGSGNYVWDVTLTNGSLVSAANVVFEAEFTGTTLVGGVPGTGTVTGVNNGGVESATLGTAVLTDSWVLKTGGTGSAFAEGLQTDPAQGTSGQAFYAFGTGDLADGASLLLGSFTTAGPSLTELSTSITISNGEVAQDDGSGPPSSAVITTGLGAAGTYTATPGDADLTGGVGLADFTTVLNNFGTTQSWAGGNFDNLTNTDVGLSDFTTVLNNFGAPSGGIPAAAAATSTPEPASALVALLGVAGLAARRRRQESVRFGSQVTSDS